jgi:peptide/nickel transport system permease protein
MGKSGFFIVLGYILLSLIGPFIAPHDPLARQRLSNGDLALAEPPSSELLLGTTVNSNDVLSQVIIGAQTSVFIGIVTASLTIFVGANIGLISGYYGGRIDDVIMRFTDLVFGLPFLPFVIVLISIIGTGVFEITIAVSTILWRSSARVIRSEVLSIKEEQFVEELRNLGASDIRILYKHVAPNVLPIILLYAALALGLSVILEANLSFLGLGAPLAVSWGGMIFGAFQRGMITHAWWWTFPPGIMISIFVLGSFMFARSLEMITDPELQK